MKTYTVICFLALGVSGFCEDNPHRKMVAYLNELLEEGWGRASVEPSAPASDSEFLRRVYLDVTGTIPRVSETREFLRDSRPGKRGRLVEQLLTSPRHATYMSHLWRDIILPPGADARTANRAVVIERWLRQQFQENVPYDRWTAELVRGEGRSYTTGPATFYAVPMAKPELFATNVSRAFLGVQIHCAQCHDHPFDDWKQEDFWDFAAFFTGITPQVNRGRLDTAPAVLKIPDTELEAVPRLLGNKTAASLEKAKSRRDYLANWMVGPKNPYFARAAANRLWAQFFGRGLVNPVDDLGPSNPPSNPQLLEALADYLVETGFDLRAMSRLITATRAYQLSSIPPPGDLLPADLFAQMNAKPMTATQLFGSLAQATLRSETNGNRGIQFNYRGLDPARQAFVAKFQTGPGGSAIEYRSGIPQALTLMNGEVTGSAVRPSTGQLLKAMDAPFLSNDQRIETLFLATLSRFPTAEEEELFGEYLDQAKPQELQSVLGDVLWALLNSAEFSVNH